MSPSDICLFVEMAIIFVMLLWIAGKHIYNEIKGLRKLKRLEMGNKDKSVSLLERKPTQDEINDACLNMDHSFGLMDAESSERLAREALCWLDAWKKVILSEPKQKTPTSLVSGMNASIH